MKIWALSDLHLALAVDKPMHVFGDHWRDHTSAWRRPGMIAWPTTTSS